MRRLKEIRKDIKGKQEKQNRKKGEKRKREKPK